MSTITNIKLWYDVGFTDGCIEVPKINGSLPSPSFSYESSFCPSTSDMFSRLKLRVPFTTLMNCSYLSISLDMNNGIDKVFYGWIDKVNMISDSESNPLTEVLWHVDLWRTYISSVVVGSGMVDRRPLLTNDPVPPQSYPYRFVTADPQFTPLFNSDKWTVVFTFNYNYSSDNTKFTASGVGYFPISRVNERIRQKVGDYEAPSLYEVVFGEWDELLGLDPESIKGVFICPGDNFISAYNASPYKISSPTSAKCGFYRTDGMVFGPETRIDLTAPITTNDITTYYITGFDGELVGSIPWGMTVSTLYFRFIVESSSAYVQLRTDGYISHSKGTCFTIPLPSLELSSNAWSSYVYSGARSADMMQKKTEADMTRESTYISTLSNVSSSVASSAMLGSLGGPVGSLGGALIGGASSIISGTIGAEANYALTTKYNDAFQDIADYRTANQTNGLMISGGGFDAIANGSVPSIVKVTKDEYSIEQRANDISLYGVHVSEPRTSCQSLLLAGGPLQITNAVVTGSVPVEAKQYIRQRLAQGVRMI